MKNQKQTFDNPILVENKQDVIDNIITVESYINEDASEDEYNDIVKYIKRGHNFVTYRVDNNWHFVPSRFVGYKNNSLIKHSHYCSDHLITGWDTDRRLDSFFSRKSEDGKLEKLYDKFCISLGINRQKRIPKFWILDEDLESNFTNTTPFFEGATKIRLHKQKERNQIVVKEAKRLFKKQNGHVYCEVCGFDFEKQYGKYGEEYIEAHHNIPVSTRNEKYEIKPDDFTMLCSNCHSIIHRFIDENQLDVDRLKNVIKIKF